MGFITGFVAVLLGIGVGWAVYEWMAFAVLMLLLLPFVEQERGWRITFTLVAAFALACFATGGNFIIFIRDNPLRMVEYVVGYLALGAFWSLFKWNKYCYQVNQEVKAFIKERTPQWIDHLQRKIKEDKPPLPTEEKKAIYQAQIDQLKTGKLPDEMIDSVRSEWYKNNPRSSRSRSMQPSALQHKQMLTTWIAFWPWSLVNYAVYRMIVDILNWMWRRLTRLYAAISDRHFKDIDARLLKDD